MTKIQKNFIRFNNLFLQRVFIAERKKPTSPIPIPNTNRPTIIMAKSGATAVTRAPTRYRSDASINSLLLPLIQKHQFRFTEKYTR